MGEAKQPTISPTPCVPIRGPPFSSGSTEQRDQRKKTGRKKKKEGKKEDGGKTKQRGDKEGGEREGQLEYVETARAKAR